MVAVWWWNIVAPFFVVWVMCFVSFMDELQYLFLDDRRTFLVLISLPCDLVCHKLCVDLCFLHRVVSEWRSID